MIGDLIGQAENRDAEGSCGGGERVLWVREGRGGEEDHRRYTHPPGNESGRESRLESIQMGVLRTRNRERERCSWIRGDEA